jgi:hypothetical protein
MTFRIQGLSLSQFEPLFDLDEAALAARGVLRRIADRRPGYPCRVTLDDAAPGERVLLLNHESHVAQTPYRSAYAIYVREAASASAVFEDEAPPVMRARPIAFRHFDREGMLVGASLALRDDAAAMIRAAFEDEGVAYLHAHNAAHGCFVARIDRASSSAPAQ